MPKYTIFLRVEETTDGKHIHPTFVLDQKDDPHLRYSPYFKFPFEGVPKVRADKMYETFLQEYRTKNNNSLLLRQNCDKILDMRGKCVNKSEFAGTKWTYVSILHLKL